MMKRLLPHIAAVVAFLVLCAVYFMPQLEGKMIRQGDIIQHKGMAQELREFKEQTGETTLWTNGMFGGMPTYQINTNREGNFMRQLNNVLSLWIGRPIGIFFLAMISFYLMLISLKVDPWLSAIGAIAFSFTTNNFVLFEAGHVTKVHSIAYLPMIAAGIILAFRNRYLLGGILFAAGTGLNLYANHVQMTYVFVLTLGIYAIAALVDSIRKKTLPAYGKAVAILAIAGLLGVGSSAVNLWTTYEYSKDTMRGTPILEQGTTDAAIASSSETDGLSWDYAMQWSNGTLDLFSTFIPRVVGGASGEVLGRDSELYKFFKKRGASIGVEFPAPMYWGSLPVTSGPNYFGAIIVFLFVLGLLVVKGPEKWWLGLGVLLTLMLSMGRNLEWFNEFFFNYVPMYNKFRTPNSVLSVTAVLVPLLGILGLSKIMKGELEKQEVLQKLYISLGITAGIAAFFWLLGPSFLDFAGARDASYEQSGYSVKAIITDRQSLMRADALRSLLFVLLAGGLIWAYVQEKLKANVILISLAVLTIADLWGVGKRYVNGDDFVGKRNYEQLFAPRNVDTQILQQEPHRGAYRVVDYSTGDPFSSTKASFFHSSIGGYHAAKLQRIQDIYDYHISKQNARVMDMFNVKYLITGQTGSEKVQVNPGARGNAWAVDTIKFVPTANAEIEGLGANSFDPYRQAIVHDEFREYVGSTTFERNGSIELTSYKPNHLTYKSDGRALQLVVFSEVWYGPNKGWQAYIDGEPVDHIRANYILRAMRVPSGQHTIEFKFEPRSYYIGKAITTVSSLLILLALLGFVGWNGYQLYLNPENKE